MSDSDINISGFVQQSEPGNPIPEMSFWQKAGFIGMPIGWTLLSITWFILGGITFILSALLLILILIHRIREADVRDLFLALLGSLVLLAPSSAGLWISGRKVLQAIRRRRTTGSYFPCGDELVAWRTMRQGPSPLWTRIAAVALFCWFAIGPTGAVILSGYRKSPSMSVVAALLCIEAILAAIAFIPRRAKTPEWFSPSVAATFGLVGLISTHLALDPHVQKGFWAYSALMLTLSVLSGAHAIRSNRRKMRHSIPSH